MKIPIKLDPTSDQGAKPSVRELLSSVNFNPLKGTIDLNGARIVMQRANVGHVMREELRNLMGEEETRVFLMRQGYLTGRADALFVQESWPHLNIGDAFTAGTRLHTFTGTVRVETVYNDFDFKRGRFAGEFIWHDSVEAEQIAQNGLRTSEPCCWTLVGYASGYATAFFRKPILYKEMSCIAQGKQHCRVIGKPVEDWNADDPAVIRFRDRVIPREPIKPAHRSRPSSKTHLVDQITNPIRDAAAKTLEARLPCIVSGPVDSGRKCALAAMVGPGDQEPVWHDGESLTLNSFENALSSQQPLLIDRLEFCSPEVQRHLARGRLPFHGVTTLSPDQIKGDQRIETPFFNLLVVGTVVMPAYRDRLQSVRLEIAALIADGFCQQLGRPSLSQDTLLALDRMEAVTGLSQLKGILRQLILNDDTVENAVAAFIRPVRDIEAEPRLSCWIDDTLAHGVLDVNQLEHMVRTAALEREGGNLAAAARRLGLTRAQLAYRMKADVAKT